MEIILTILAVVVITVFTAIIGCSLYFIARVWAHILRSHVLPPLFKKENK